MKLHITGHRPIDVSCVRVALETDTGLVHYVRLGTDRTPACDPPLKGIRPLIEQYLKDHPPTCFICATVGVWTSMFTV